MNDEKIAPNVIALRDEVLKANPRAEDKLFHILYDPLYRSLYKMRPDRVEDATQEGLIEIFSSLSRFDPLKGKGDPERNMFNWALSIAKYKELATLRRQKSQEATLSDPPNENDPTELDEVYNYELFRLDDTLRPVEKIIEDGEEPELDIEQLREKFHQKLSEILPAPLLYIVESKIAGKSHTTIAEELGWIHKTISTKLAEARKIIEEKMIFPAGFKRVSTYNDHALATAAYRGSMQAVLFLNMQYTTDEWVQSYRVTKGKKSNASAENVIFREDSE